MDNLIGVIKYLINVVLSILKYSSWPIVILIIFVKYKKYILGILENTATISYGDLQINFKKSLVEIDNVKKPKHNIEIDDDEKELVGMKPDMAVIYSFRSLEVALRDLYNKSYDFGKIDSAQPKFQPASIMWRKLEELQIVSHDYSKLFKILSRMRNEAVHLGSKISYEDAIKYVQQVANMNKYLTDVKNNITN